MEIFGIGLPEILFVLLIAVIVLGPRDMTQAARTVGKFLRSVVTSEWWQSFKTGVQEVRKLPYQLMREAGMEEDYQAYSEVASVGKQKNLRSEISTTAPRGLQAWTNFSPGEPLPDLYQQLSDQNKILPPNANPDLPKTEIQNPNLAAQEGHSEPPQADAAG